MIIPVRCMSCGKPLADKWEEFQKRASKGQKQAKVLDDMGITRYCCRSAMITHADLLDSTSKHKVNVEEEKK